MSIERKLRRRNAARGETKVTERNQAPVYISRPAAEQAGNLAAVVRRDNEQLNAYLAGVRAALEVPDSWPFDLGIMAFVPPPAPPPPAPPVEQSEQSEQGEGAA